METLESSRVCRLCGKHSGISINIFDKNENHVKKINAVLPIMVHEMDLLPKHMCHRCSYKLEEFHKFYIDCLKTDADLKSQLSWMRKEERKERIGIPMVHIENLKIKIEPPEYDVYELDPIVENVNYINSMSSVTFPVNGVRQPNGIHEGIAYAYAPRCGCYCDKNDQSRQTVPKEYENRAAPISRCNTGINDRTTNALQAVRKNLFTRNNVIREQSSVESPSKEKRRCKLTNETKLTGSSTSATSLAKTNLTEKKNKIKNIMVRNLRPRKGSIDYGGSKKRSAPETSLNKSKNSEVTPSSSTMVFDISRIKIEKTEDVEGRTLRPRNRLIDYSVKRPWRHREATRSSKRLKAKTDQNEQKLYGDNDDDRMKITIKQEPLDFEKTHIENPKPTTGVVRNLSKSVESTLPNNAKAKENFHLDIKPASLKFITKRKSCGMNIPRRDGTTFKYLRSCDPHLRNGKVRTLYGIDGEKKAKKLKGPNDRCPKVPMDQLKLLENIKHYCEKCNMTFANSELYKLHACYD